jgi:hypothetical protein
MTEGKRPFPSLARKPRVGLRNACILIRKAHVGQTKRRCSGCPFVKWPYVRKLPGFYSLKNKATPSAWLFCFRPAFPRNSASSGGSSNRRADAVRLQSFLTAPERSFILVREGRMGFQADNGYVTETARKRKFLSLFQWLVQKIKENIMEINNGR